MNFQEKAIFVWNDFVIGDTPKVTGLLVSAGFEAAHLHSTNVGNWRTTSRVALSAALKAAGIEVYASVAVYGDKPNYGWTATEEGHKAAAIVNAYGLAGCVFDVETGAYERAANGAALMTDLLNAYAEMTAKPAAFCGWAQYDNAHPVDVLKAAMGHSAVAVGMPMAYWYNGELPSHAEYTATKSYAQWRKYTNKPIVMAGRAYTDSFTLSDGTSRTVHARPDAIAAFEARSRQLGAVGITWWDMEHALPIEGVWDALAATPGYSDGNDDGGTGMDYTKNAIGLVAENASAAGWENPAFTFAVGYAGGDWSKRADGSIVYEPNDDLKPMELKAKANGWPFLALWDFDAHDYIDKQIGASDALWPDEEHDYPLTCLKNALASRNIDGLVIRVMSRKDYYGNDHMMNYIAFAAHKFVERANRWLYTTKGLRQQTIVLTCDPFVRQDGKQEYFYGWMKPDFPAIGVEQAAIALRDNAYPADAETPGAIGNTTWAFWYHYWPGRTKVWNTEPALLDRNWGMVIYNGDAAHLRAFLGVEDTNPPDPGDDDDPPQPTELTARVTALEAQLQTLQARVADVIDALHGA